LFKNVHKFKKWSAVITPTNAVIVCVGAIFVASVLQFLWAQFNTINTPTKTVKLADIYEVQNESYRCDIVCPNSLWGYKACTETSYFSAPPTTTELVNELPLSSPDLALMSRFPEEKEQLTMIPIQESGNSDVHKLPAPAKDVNTALSQSNSLMCLLSDTDSSEHHIELDSRIIRNEMFILVAILPSLLIILGFASMLYPVIVWNKTTRKKETTPPPPPPSSSSSFSSPIPTPTGNGGNDE
jgi:hypothetical protein